ncbi:prolyl oligopeptidase family serine peptidase [Candidatus Clostridium radicumherbarum]|uniref:Prolyl oligopeptidase family serine peptidase n=1 Tax=Candidatus Clostridium radicumherbarum TaxID=3381662 RepID=A0ABW8TP09_9CLOT
MLENTYNFSKTIIKKINLNYLLYTPKDYNEDVKFPLVMFLHGSGERGDNLELLKLHGIPKLISQGKDFPFIAISPQCPSSVCLTELTEDLNLLIEDIISNYSVDPEKIYLTGISMGGFAAWKLACKHPEKFAAILPICGGPWNACYDEEISNLKDIAVWAFHGAKDEVVPIEGTKAIIDNLRAIGNNAKFTVYPDLGHDSWSLTYENPEVYSWLLNQKKIK